MMATWLAVSQLVERSSSHLKASGSDLAKCPEQDTEAQIESGRPVYRVCVCEWIMFMMRLKVVITTSV